MPLPQERPPLPRKLKGWCVRTGPVILVLHPDGQKGLAIGRLYWQRCVWQLQGHWKCMEMQQMTLQVCQDRHRAVLTNSFWHFRDQTVAQEMTW